MKFIKRIKDCWMYEVEDGDNMVTITEAWSKKNIKWTGGVASVAEKQFLGGHWPLQNYILQWALSMRTGDVVIVDADLNIPEQGNNRYLVYNPLSSLPITSTYSSERQARHVAEAMTKKHNEPFFVCRILYGVLQDDNFKIQEIASDSCR